MGLGRSRLFSASRAKCLYSALYSVSTLPKGSTLTSLICNEFPPSDKTILSFPKQKSFHFSTKVDCHCKFIYIDIWKKTEIEFSCYWVPNLPASKIQHSVVASGQREHNIDKAFMLGRDSKTTLP